MTDEKEIGLTGDGFMVPVSKFQDLVDPKNFGAFTEMGALEGIAKSLKADVENGLGEEDGTKEIEGETKTIHHLKRREIYGENRLPKPKSKTFFSLVFDAASDKTLILLTIAAAISIGIGIYEDIDKERKGEPEYVGSWIEGIAIFVAVILVILVNSVNDYQKERQFRKLYDKKEDREVQVIRSGKQLKISIFDVVVGDVVVLNTGDIICADGVFISGHNVTCDESGMTGESDAIKKNSHKDPFLLSGTKVLDGVGKMLAIAVGVNSLNGKTLLSLRTDVQNTPLQDKLDKLASVIGKVGFTASLLMLVILILRYFLEKVVNDEEIGDDVAEKMIQFVITAITVIVVAVPEGLPMAVTLALAYATIQMLKDNNLVRVLAACETMGGATTICSDKTGTLTQNKMTVVRGTVMGREFKSVDEVSKFASDLPEKVRESLVQNIAVNSTAYEDVEDGKPVFVGSKTESALLGFAKTIGYEYMKVREQHPALKLFPFSSEKKRMSVLVKGDNGARIYCKGASEIVLSYCTKMIGPDGSVVPLGDSEKKLIEETILAYATEALRTIALAYNEIGEVDVSTLEEAPERELVFIGVVGIQDPLRPEVPHAIEQCKRAGIKVRMVTGDNLITAKNIAKNCGILTENGVILEGPVFRKMSEKEMDEVIPRLDVLARSSPTDKQLLVSRLKAAHQTVAVTGDGTNDAPALKLADVGFAMGIAGTEVAKEASDIILMDDNFASIVKAVIWGRSVFDSVRKFLQFQLTVNVTAVSLAIISAISDGEGESVLTAVQLLWVNLIMDTMAALALATEPPSEDLLNRKPQGKKDPLINFKMWKMIIGQAIFQIAVNLALLNAGIQIFETIPVTEGDMSQEEIDKKERRVIRTMVFNTFVFMQIFNEFNARRIDDRINVFERILQHKIFIGIFFITVFFQVLVVEFGSEAFKTTHLRWELWLTCVAIGFFSLPWGLVLRLIPDISHKWEKKEEVEAEPSAEKLLIN